MPVNKTRNQMSRYGGNATLTGTACAQQPVAPSGGRKTRCSAIADRPRCRVRYSFGQKWKTGTGRQYFTFIIGLSSTTVI